MKKPEHQQALELLVEGNPRKQKLLETLLSADDALLERFEKVMPYPATASRV
jgi:predicted NAD/FAD-binding protein